MEQSVNLFQDFGLMVEILGTHLKHVYYRWFSQEFTIVSTGHFK